MKTPPRPVPRFVRFYLAHREIVEAALGTATWLALLGGLLFAAPAFS